MDTESSKLRSDPITPEKRFLLAAIPMVGAVAVALVAAATHFHIGALCVLGLSASGVAIANRLSKRD